MNWRERAASIRWDIRAFIDGRYRNSNATECFENIDPATEAPLCSVAVGHATDVDEAVVVARRRFSDGCWSELLPQRRADVLRKLADLIVVHKEQFALFDTLEMGKPIQSALYDAGIVAPGLLRSCAGLADKLFGATAPLNPRTLAFNAYQPRGVVAAITPWNFPVVNAVVKIAPALAAGNTVVLKPSELSSGSALKLAELALEAGVPEGVLNVVPGLGSTVGSALARHPGVDLLSFTGSTMTGRKIMELSARSNGKPLLLECGGKSPQVVFDDIDDLNAVAQATVQSVLWNQGQVCSAHTRLIVHNAVKASLLEKVVQLARHYKPGDPLSEQTLFGPMASPGQRDRVKSYVEQGLSDGAEAVLKGEIQERRGCNVSPTIFDRVDARMSIVRDEIFGPVLCIQEFRTDQEAIALANGTDYGLAATVWTRDIARARRMAFAINAGAIFLRTSGKEEEGDTGLLLGHEPQKASGFGAELGIEGVRSYSTLKAINWCGN